jgi:hypothetical protein
MQARLPTLVTPGLRAWLAALMPFGLMACASAPPPPVLDPPQAIACREWMDRLDVVTDAHAVRDGSAAQVPGYGFVRVNRLLASFIDQAAAGEAPWQAWGARVLALDGEARAAETANLPPQALSALGVPDAKTAQARARTCGQVLWAAVSAQPAQRQHLLQRARVPDDYSTVLRTLGLYPLSQWPFFSGVERELDRWQARWNAAGLAPDETSGWLRLQASPGGQDPVTVGALMGGMPRDALGIPRPDETTARALLQAHAPVLEVAQRGVFDRPGRLRWGAGPAPEVESDEPVVYQRLAHTRWGPHTLLQLVYSVWFSERPPRSPLDLLAGRVDGVVIRLTLDPEGRLLLLDSMHACGCYHVFVPTAHLTPRPAPAPRTEWAFVPGRLPALQPGQRLRVRLSSADHQVLGVAPDEGGSAPAYALLDEDTLRSLPLADGTRRSAFDSRGLMPGTERGERVLFWPMGITSPGAMRQWGRHPTAFVGRRHFDDARLIEQRFSRSDDPAGH